MADSERPSPFTIPSSSLVLARDENEPEKPRPPRSMTVGGMIRNLIAFADFYEHASENIDALEAMTLKIWALESRDNEAYDAQQGFRDTAAIDLVRAYVLAKFGKDLTIGTARRLLGNLCIMCGLEGDTAEALSLQVAMDRLNAAESRRGDNDEAGKREAVTPAVVQAEATPAAASTKSDSLALMRVFTNGIADDRIEKATRLLADNKLTVNEKLTKIDALIPFPATASAEQLGEMLSVTKQAVLKTDWWIQNRKGEKESEVGRRREGHRKRAKGYEAPEQGDDE